MGLKSRNQLERVISASLISQIWLVCSRMFPSRFPTTHKCRICGVDVETTEVRAHYRTTHPEFGGWGNHWKRLSWLLLISDMALAGLNLLIIRSVIPIFDYVVIACLSGSVLVLIFTMVSKQGAFREAWNRTHPSPNSSTTQNGLHASSNF